MTPDTIRAAAENPRARGQDDTIRAALREAERAMVASNKHDLVMAAATVAAFLRARAAQLDEAVLPVAASILLSEADLAERAARGGEG